MSILTATGRDSRWLRLDVPLRIGTFPELQEVPGGSMVPGSRMWIAHVGKHGRVSVIASIDGGRMHLSVAHSSRYPTWEEITAVREWAFPDDVEVVMVLARKADYVNLHNNCFHLYESACGREAA